MTNASDEDETPAPLVAVVASDQTLVREGIGVLIARSLPGAHVVEIQDVHGLATAARRWSAARLVVLDLCMPGLRDGVVVRELSDRFPHWRLVVLAGAHSPAVLRRIARQAAVYAVLPRHASVAALTDGIDAAMQGRRLAMAQDPGAPHTKATLTPRQLDIVKLLRLGMSNKVIAARLDISEGTVKNHITDVLRALNVTDRTQAARLDLGIE